MPNWIEQVLKATSESEAPERYFYWGALASISAVLRRNCYLDRFYYKLYTNIYVMCIGRSGLRKGVPINVMRSMVDKIDCTRVIAGRNSVQAILVRLGTQTTKEHGRVIKDAEAFLVGSEFGSFLVRDPDALTLMTDLYDSCYHEKWENNLKYSPVDSLSRPCITLFGGSNEAHFNDVVSTKDIEGGFLARTIIVYEDEKRLINPLTERPKNIDSMATMHQYLFDVAKYTGEFKWASEGVRLSYDRWYKAFESTQRVDPTGTLERLGDTVLKVACLVSASEDGSLQIKNRHLEEAIFRCQECYGGTQRVSMGSGRSPLARQTASILQILLTAPENKLTRLKLLQRGWGEFDAIDLDRIVETLSQGGMLESFRVGKDIMYKLTRKVVETYRQVKSNA